MLAVNTLAVATMVGLQTGQPPPAVWRRQVRAFDWAEHGAQLALGLLAALAVEHHPWVLPLLALPALAVYQTLLRQAELRQRLEDALLAEVGRLAAAPARPDTLAGMVEAAGRGLGDGALLFLTAPGRPELALAGWYHRDPEARARQRQLGAAAPPRRGAGAVGAVAAGDPALLLRDALADAATGGASNLAALGFRTAVCVPVRDEAGVLGVLVVGSASRRRALDERDLAVAEAVAGQIAASLARAGSARSCPRPRRNCGPGWRAWSRGSCSPTPPARSGSSTGGSRRSSTSTSGTWSDARRERRRRGWRRGWRTGPRPGSGCSRARRGRRGPRAPSRSRSPGRPAGSSRATAAPCATRMAIVGRLAVFTDVTAARRQARARDEFLAVAGHELKAPLTTVGGYLELLEAQLGKPGAADPVRLARYTGSAREELARLGRLAEDLLAVARAETGPLPLRTGALDLAALARAVAARFAGRPDLAASGHASAARRRVPSPPAATRSAWSRSW